MRGFFADVCIPLIFVFVIMTGICALFASYSCSEVGALYKVDTKTSMLECYVNTPAGWMKQADFELARIMGKL